MTKKDDELSGFRDFLDGDKELKRSLKHNDRSRSSGYEILSFLENESSRLDKLLEVMEEKSYLINSCNSFDTINRGINREISLAHAEMTQILFKKDSPMMKSLEELFGHIFRTNS